MRAISALKFEAGISTSSRSACRPLRMRVRKSAMGSVIDIGLPARLREAGNHALVGDLAQADAAEPELAQVRARAAAALAAVVVPCLVLGPAGKSLPLLLCLLARLGFVLVLCGRGLLVRLWVLFLQCFKCLRLGLGLQARLLAALLLRDLVRIDVLLGRARGALRRERHTQLSQE